MVLLDLFVKGYEGDFSVATVNHRIREQGQSDCLFVKDYCTKHNVKCEIFTVDVPSYAKQNKLSVETAARILRHDALKKAAKGRVIVTAHHQNDQAESVLMHLLRGSGAKGLCGMQKEEEGFWRPLLDINKSEILQYARYQNIPFVQDCTNADDAYTRNFLRNKIFPLLEKINGNAVSNIARCSALIAKDQIFMESVAGVVLAKTPLVCEEEKVLIPLDIFSLNPSLTSRIVFLALSKLGAQKDIEQSHIDDICLLSAKQNGKEIHLPFNLTALKDYEGIIIFRPEVAQSEQTQLPFGIGEYQIGQKTVVISQEGEGLRFDINKVPKDALLRTRKKGDYFTKFGGGTKSLASYLSDKKIKKQERDSLILIASGSEVLAVAGVEISEKIKTEENSDIYKIYYKEIY